METNDLTRLQKWQKTKFSNNAATEPKSDTNSIISGSFKYQTPASQQLIEILAQPQIDLPQLNELLITKQDDLRHTIRDPKDLIKKIDLSNPQKRHNLINALIELKQYSFAHNILETYLELKNIKSLATEAPPVVISDFILLAEISFKLEYYMYAANIIQQLIHIGVTDATFNNLEISNLQNMLKECHIRQIKLYLTMDDTQLKLCLHPFPDQLSKSIPILESLFSNPAAVFKEFNLFEDDKIRYRMVDALCESGYENVAYDITTYFLNAMDYSEITTDSLNDFGFMLILTLKSQKFKETASLFEKALSSSIVIKQLDYQDILSYYYGLHQCYLRMDNLPFYKIRKSLSNWEEAINDASNYIAANPNLPDNQLINIDYELELFNATKSSLLARSIQNDHSKFT